MADYKINHMTGRLYKLFTTSPSSYYDYQVNRVQDIVEDIAYSESRTIFAAKVLTGGSTNINSQASSEESESLATKVINFVSFSEDSKPFKTYAVKFRFTGDDADRNQIPDPNTASDPKSQNILISLHNYAVVSADIISLSPGDLIEVREEDGTYYVNKKLDGTAQDTIISTDQGSISAFNSNRSPRPLGEVLSQDALGKNQAKFYTPADRVNNNQIEMIILHSTDGIVGDGAAQKTISRFAEGPTLAFEWTNRNTGKTTINPPCKEVMETDGKLPKGTICHPTRKQVEEVAHTSIHYAVDQGGNVIQGVLDKDIAHHAGSDRNKISIGIEMTGRPNSNPGAGANKEYSGMYTETLLNATAGLVANLCAKYNLGVNRKVIIGHDEFASKRRTDPGTYTGNFDWEDFLIRVKKIHNNIKIGN